MPGSRPSTRTAFEPQVVLPALAVIGALLVVCALFSSGQQWVVARFDWFYVLAVTTFLVFLVLIAASGFGNIRLGPDVEYLRGDVVIADVLRQYERYESLAADIRTHLLSRAPGHATEAA
ncbi:BCCT family transporter [Burkholderia sp. BCC1988]|uniref:BCCT family transporter n=1 Tax=Burkholderia sp. BCC1988 TaxID=2817443 RepID=UPI0039EE91CA